MDGHKFDEMTRALANGTSRRAVLRRLGAGLAGLGLAALGRGAVRADSLMATCAEFCLQVPAGPARGACFSEAAQGTGPCYQCGPAATSSLFAFCPVTGACTSTSCPWPEVYNPATCACECGYGSMLCEATGACLAIVCGGDRRVYSPTTCRCECKPGYVENACGACVIPCDPAGPPCPVGECMTEVDGTSVCASRSYAGSCSPPLAPACTSTADCCACGTNGVCMPDGRCNRTL